MDIDNLLRESEILRKYHIDNRNDYILYNRLVGKIHSIIKLKKLAK